MLQQKKKLEQSSGAAIGMQTFASHVVCVTMPAVCSLQFASAGRRRPTSRGKKPKPGYRQGRGVYSQSRAAGLQTGSCWATTHHPLAIWVIKRLRYPSSAFLSLPPQHLQQPSSLKHRSSLSGHREPGECLVLSPHTLHCLSSLQRPSLASSFICTSTLPSAPPRPPSLDLHPSLPPSSVVFRPHLALFLIDFLP
jgi:hypothetical protein